MLNSDHLVVSGIEETTPYNLHYYKVTFGTEAVDWATKMLWGSSYWEVGLSEILVNSDNTKLYNFSIFGYSLYIHFVTLDVTNGALVGSHYISNMIWSNVYGSAQAGDYIIATVNCEKDKVVIFNVGSNKFSIWFFNGILYGAAYDSANGV